MNSMEWHDYYNHLQISLQESDVTLRLPRMYHSATVITLCPGLVEVIEFGGYSDIESSIIAETSIITFSKLILCNNILR